MDLWAWSLLAVGACLLLYAALVLALVIAGRHESARALAGFIPDCVVLCSRLLRDPRVPRRKKALLIALTVTSRSPSTSSPISSPSPASSTTSSSSRSSSAASSGAAGNPSSANTGRAPRTRSRSSFASQAESAPHHPARSFSSA
jgi:hypothetical protein